MTDSRPVLTMTGISKSFPGVRALHNVNFQLFPGEVHALMGENGAGKSTLIKVLTGVYDTDDGTTTLDGEPVSFTGPMQANAAGVSTVYQEVNLCTNLSVAENIFIGREPRLLGAVRWGEVRRRARTLLSRLDLDLDVSAPLGSYSLAIQQMVAIARAIDIKARVLILDEPTSSLDASEVAQLFRIMRQLRDEGIAILFVTHFLDQVYEIADRITVLRNGGLVGEYLTAELPQLSLVEKMIGKELDVLEGIEEHSRRDLAALEEGTPWWRCRTSAGRGRSSRSASPSTPARWWAWPACWALGVPRLRGCCSGPTGRTAARSPSTARQAAYAPLRRPSTMDLASVRRTAAPKASSPTCRSART